MTASTIDQTGAVNAPVIATTWDLAESVLASKLPGYEPRREQTRLARSVERSLQSGDTLLAQAGTGTGKSFAGLIPAIQRALQSGGRVIVATGTIALQGQYTLEDLPFLADALDAEAMGQEWNFAELKGRSNYLCPEKVLGEPDVENIAEIIAASEVEGFSGDIAHLPAGLLAPADVRKVTTTSEECPGTTNCPVGEMCFAARAKERAASAQIVVVNHALLAIDLSFMKEEYDEATGEFEGYTSVILGQYDRVIIDEAHNFENYVTNMIGAQLTEGTFTSLAAEAAGFLEDETAGRVLSGQAKKLFDDMRPLFEGKNRSESTVRLPDAYAGEVGQRVSSLIAEIDKIQDAITATGRIMGDKKRSGRKARLAKRIETLRGKLGVLAPQVSGETLAKTGQVVRWVQREEGFKGAPDKIIVGYSPLSVANFLRERLWSTTSGVLLSATLFPNGDQDFIAGQLGIDEYDVFDAGTPFDYESQAGIYIPEDLDPRKGGEWTGGGHQLTMKAVDAANGRALLLFTSRREMEARFKLLAPELEEVGYACHIQRKGVPVNQLIAEKKADPTSVIFGLHSLGEGVSVPGDALRLVIIDKLPFPVPTEVVFSARCEAMDRKVAKREGCELDKAKFRKGGSWNGLTIPTMALKLEQYIGRLIRTTSDRGVVVVMDSRLHPKVGSNYGKPLFRRLPPAEHLATERDMVKYLRALAKDDRE